MKRLAFILIALFSLNIISVFAQESQDSQESSSVRSSSSAVGSYTGEKPKSNMVLREMLLSPMGNVPASHELMKYGDVKKAAKGTYTVDDASDRDANSFFIFKNDNPRTSSLFYHGFQFSNYYFSVSKRYTHYDRRFNYELKLKSNISTAKAFLEYVVKDFNDFGIPLKNFDAKSKYVKALLNYKEGVKCYTVELNDYGSGPTLSIDVSYKKP